MRLLPAVRCALGCAVFSLLALLTVTDVAAQTTRPGRVARAADRRSERVTPGGRRAALRVERGQASFYARRFHGRRTASGERYNHEAMTVAHRTLPFGTRLRVTNERNGRSIVVRVNDRGPFHRGRVLDLSGAAARQLGVGGVAPVRIEVLDGRGEPEEEPAPAARPDTSNVVPEAGRSAEPVPFLAVKPRHV